MGHLDVSCGWGIKTMPHRVQYRTPGMEKDFLQLDAECPTSLCPTQFRGQPASYARQRPRAVLSAPLVRPRLLTDCLPE